MAIRANLWLFAAMLAVASSFSLPTPAATLRFSPSIAPAVPASFGKPSLLKRLRGGGELKSSSSGASAGPFAPKSLGRALLAEAIGTFIIIFLGCSSVAAANMALHNGGLLVIALIWGLAVAGAATICGPVSGAHFNPAISVALATRKGPSPVPFPAKRSTWLPCYIAAQALGAFAAAGTMAFFFWSYIGSCRMVLPPGGVFGCYPNAFGIERAFAAEVLGTGLLAAGCVAFPSAWHVGAWLSTLIAIFGPISGASFNPAREFAPRLMASLLGFDVAKTMGTAWAVYLFAPIIGAVLGAVITTALRSED